MIIFAVGMVIGFINQILSFMIMPFSIAGVEALIGVVIVINIIIFILGLIAEIWDNTLGTLAATRLYQLNAKKNKK